MVGSDVFPIILVPKLTHQDEESGTLDSKPIRNMFRKEAAIMYYTNLNVWIIHHFIMFDIRLWNNYCDQEPVPHPSECTQFCTFCADKNRVRKSAQQKIGPLLECVSG